MTWGDTVDCWNLRVFQLFPTLGASPASLLLPTLMWAEMRVGDAPGPEAGGEDWASPGEACWRQDGLVGRVSSCRINTIWKPQYFWSTNSTVKPRHLYAIGRHLSCDNILFQ